jgi:hypothetical protein
MPALHAKTPLPVAANARHRPQGVMQVIPCYGCAFRIDPWRFDAPLGRGQKTLNLLPLTSFIACSIDRVEQ